MTFINYIEDIILGKIAYFINEKNEMIFAKVIVTNELEIFQELTEEEKEEFLKRLNEEIL